MREVYERVDCIEIGSNVIIGTCSVVTNSVVARIPAKVISTFDDYVEK